MRKLLFLGMALALMACGDDDGREPGTDSGTPGVDSGTPGTDSGTPGTDSGTPGTDSGTPGTDSGMSTGMCPVGDCDLVSNAGCDAAMGEGCYWLLPMEGADPEPLCNPAGTGTTGTPCDAPFDCQEGLTCDEGECRKVCCGGSDATCDPGDICINFSDGAGMLTGFGACRTPSDCDVIEQTGCPEGEACYVISNDASVDCITPPVDGGTQGDSCDSLNSCAPGFLCLTPEGGSSACVQACNPMSPVCPDGTSCARVGSFPADLGACLAM